MPTKRKPAVSPVETEAKIRVSSFVAVKRRMVAAGGRLLSPRTLEANTLFDAPNGSLRAAGKSLRVRRYGAKGTVTLKGVARVEGGLKSREELETQVTSPETLAEILLTLGFVPQFRYEKFREVWKVGPTVVCLDQTPLGRFVEIEGAAAAVHRVGRSLGFEATAFISVSYPALWVEAGRSGPMVFPAESKPAGRRSARGVGGGGAA
jgi:adenylate cyclase class 2